MAVFQVSALDILSVRATLLERSCANASCWAFSNLACLSSLESPQPATTNKLIDNTPAIKQRAHNFLFIIISLTQHTNR